MPTSSLELMLRLLLAAGLGAAIGVERELRQKPAGLRTNILIALGSALFVAVSIAFGHAGGTPDRIAAQVVTGIGFLGGGAILRSGTSVHGMTTAATIWVNAAVGMAAGAGLYDRDSCDSHRARRAGRVAAARKLLRAARGHGGHSPRRPVEAGRARL